MAQLSKVLNVVCCAGSVIVQELCECRGGRPGLSVLTNLLVSKVSRFQGFIDLLVSVDVKNY